MPRFLIARASFLIAVSVLVLLTVAVLPCAAQSVGSRSGWDAVAKNQRAAAHAAFQAALKQHPADAAALDGLAELEDEEDHEASAVSHWRELYHVAPASWQAAADWPDFAQTAGELARWDLLDGAARDILASASAIEPLKASAKQVQLAALLRAGRITPAQAFRAGLGYVRAWQVIGPFDNVSKSGFGKPYAPEQGIDLQASVPGKDDLLLRWHPLTLVDSDGTCEVSDALGDGDADVFYAATTVVAPAACSAVLRYDPGTATKVFVNGQAVVSDEIARDQQELVADPFAVPVALRAGRNTILVKMATEKHASAVFTLRLTTPDGTPLLLATDAGHVAAGPVQSGVVAPPVDLQAAALVRAQPDSLERSLALQDLWYRSSDYQAAEDEGRRELAVLPDCGPLHWEMSVVLGDDDQGNDAKAEYEAAVAHDPGNLSAQMNALTDAGSSLPSPEYIARLKALRASHPQSAQVLWALASALSDAKLTDASLSTARAAVALGRGPDAYIHLANLYRDADRASEEKAALIEGMTYSPNDPALIEKLATLYSDLDDVREALSEYQLHLTQVGEAAGVRIAMADIERTVKKTSLAIADLQKARQDRPQSAEVCSDLSDLYQSEGKKPQALALLTEAVRLDPEQLDLRDKQQLLAGAKPVIDLAPPIASKTVLNADLSGDQSAPGVYLLDEAREVVYPDGATMTRFHQIVRILDAAGVSLRQDYNLDDPTYTARVHVESARVTTAQGKIEDETDSARGASVPFPSLAPGDTIDITYRVEDDQRGALAHQFWTEWYFQSELEMPSKLSRFVLITPPDMTFQTRAHGPVPDPAVKDVAGWRIREWRMDNVPAIKRALLGTPARDNGTWLDVSSIDSWSTVVQWYQGLSYTQCVPDAAIRSKAAELTAGLTTPQDKMRAIVAYVARKIQYQTTPFRLSAYIPTEGKQVIREQYGDCKDKAALLTALLACAGIKSEMVLLSPRDYGVTPYLPSPRFNHAIAYVQAPDGPEFVDATADQLGFGLLPSSDQQVPVLVIDDRTKDLTLTPLPPIEQNIQQDTHVLTLDADGTLHGEMTMSFQGQWGWYLRTALKTVPAGHQDEVARAVIAKVVPNSLYESGTLVGLDKQDQPLVIQAKYHAENYGTNAGNFLLVKLPWAGQGDTSAQLADPARTQDVETASLRGDYLSAVDLTLPAGYAPQDMEMNKKITSGWGSYEVHYTFDGGVLHGKRETRMTAVRVAHKDIPAYVAFLQSIIADESKQIVLHKAGAAQ